MMQSTRSSIESFESSSDPSMSTDGINNLNCNDDDDNNNHASQHQHAVHNNGPLLLPRNIIEPTINPANSDDNNNQKDKLYKPHVQSGLFGTSSNLINAIVGAGIIGIPYAFKQSGIIAGVFLLILVVILTEKSLRLIVGLASFHPTLRPYHVCTFEDLASYPFDNIGRIFILTNMLILAYGAMLAYLLIIKDTVPPIVRSVFYSNNNKNNNNENPWNKTEEWFYANTILIVSSLVIILPLAMKRDMASLAIFSSFSVSADVILTLFIILYAPIHSTVQNAGGLRHVLSHNAIHPSTLFIAVGILSTAMACQHSCFIISESLHNKTQRRWAIVTGSSLFFAGFFTATLGIAGYLGFLNDTQGDVLNNFDSHGYEANFARFLLAITMFFTYPMESFVARHVFVVLFYKGDMDGVMKNATTNNNNNTILHQQEQYESSSHDNTATSSGSTDGISIIDNKEEDVSTHPNSTAPKEERICLGLNRRHVLSLCIFLATLIPAILLSDIGPVLSITGSLGGAFLCYFSPGMVYLGVYGEEFLQWTEQLLDSYYGYSLFKRKQDYEKSNNFSNDELPIDGTANTFLNTNQGLSSVELPLEGDSSRVLMTFPKTTHAKPFWWYIGLFPLWCAIARVGKANMRRKCDKASTAEVERDSYKPPKGIDFLYAMVFITFGIISAIAGLVTNFWFLLKK